MMTDLLFFLVKLGIIDTDAAMRNIWKYPTYKYYKIPPP
jgi:hypothetical protein